MVVQVTVEVADPDVVAVRNLTFVIHARQAERQTRIVLDFIRINFVDIKRWIRHHEISLADQLVRIFIIRYRLGNVTFKAMNGEVHLGETDRRRVLLHPEKGKSFRRILVLPLNDTG